MAHAVCPSPVARRRLKRSKKDNLRLDELVTNFQHASSSGSHHSRSSLTGPYNTKLNANSIKPSIRNAASASSTRFNGYRMPLTATEVDEHPSSSWTSLDASEAEFELDVYLKSSPYSLATALEPLITSDVHHFYLHTALTHPSLGQKSKHDWETQQTENSTQRRSPRGIADEYALPGRPDCYPDAA